MRAMNIIATTTQTLNSAIQVTFNMIDKHSIKNRTLASIDKNKTDERPLNRLLNTYG